MKRSDEIRLPMRLSLIVMVVALCAALLVMCLPLYTFEANVYTKKSSNTFVGDEKYEEALAEVEEVAAEYESLGMEVEIEESVTERTNSKGETTSLVTFTVKESFSKSLMSLVTSSLAGGRLLLIMLICMGAALIFALAGCAGSMDVIHKYLPKKPRTLRTLSCVLLLADLVLTPVLILLNNYTFWRRVSLYSQDLITEGKDAFYAQMDGCLFGSKMGEEVGSALRNLSTSHSPALWLLALCFLVALAAAVNLRFGRMRPALLRGLLYAFVIIVCIITLYPYYVMLVTGFRSNAETLDMYFLNLLPTKWIWSNLTDIVSRGVPGFLRNSLIVAGGATALAMLCGIPAAYAMARMNFRGRKFFLGFVIMSQMFSPVVLLIGISQLMNTIGLNDTLLGLIFVNAAFNQAFAIWLLRGTFISISPDMEQAAKIDGCSTVGSLLRVLIPMAAPGIVTTLIFVFINAWNEYTIATVLISTSSKKPITVGITQFSSFNMIEWQYLFAASLLATIPVVILFMFIEKHLTSGLTSGGVKG